MDGLSARRRAISEAPGVNRALEVTPAPPAEHPPPTTTENGPITGLSLSLWHDWGKPPVKGGAGRFRFQRGAVLGSESRRSPTE